MSRIRIRNLRRLQGGILFLATLFRLLLLTNPAFAGSAPGPDAFGYTVQATGEFSFTQITNAGTPRVLWFDDDATYTASIGFSFNFYGSNYSAVSFSPNGLITFGGQSSNFVNVDLITTSPGNNLPAIAVLWDDWETLENWADGVYYKTTGLVGSRQFIVQWNKIVPINGDGTNTVTFEARFFEGSDRILFSYFDTVVSDESTLVATLGVGATVGIRDVDGQTNGRNLEWSFNQAVITNGLNLLFRPPNRPPVAVNDTAVTAEDTPITLNVLTNDTDPDGDQLILLSVGQSVNGVVTSNLNSTLTFSPATNFFGTDQFDYVISDGNGGMATGTVSVTVYPVNDTPTLDPPNDVMVEENPPSQFVLLTGISSGAENETDTLTVTATSSNPDLIPTPTITYISPDPTGIVDITVASNTTGSSMITVTVNDGQDSNNIVSRTFTVTVGFVNHGPIAGADSVSTYQDIALNVSTTALLTNDYDPDPGDTLTLTNVSPASSSGGTVTLNNDIVSYLPPTGFTGPDDFTYTITDTHGSNVTGTVTVTVWPPLRIGSVDYQTNGVTVVHFDAIPGRSYAVEGSIDFATWTTLGTASETTPGTFQFEDTGTADLAARFYRLREL